MDVLLLGRLEGIKSGGGQYYSIMLDVNCTITRNCIIILSAVMYQLNSPVCQSCRVYFMLSADCTVYICIEIQQSSRCVNKLFSVCLSAIPACVFLRCLIRTARRQRRLKSAAAGWRWTWGSLRCGATPSPFAAPPTRRHRRAHRAPAPPLAPWGVKLQDTNERVSDSHTLHALLTGFHYF